MSYSLSIKFANTNNELEAVANLRYNVFSQEFKAKGKTFNSEKKIEWGVYDEICEHLICTANYPDGRSAVIGALRVKLITKTSDTFQVTQEFKIEEILRSKKACCEVSRICINQSFRNGLALFKMWQFLFNFLENRNIKIMFGLGSFYGCDINLHRDSILSIFKSYVSPLTKTIRSVQDNKIYLLKRAHNNEVQGIKNISDLMKAYLRFGCHVAPDYFIDTEFNTIDLFFILMLDERSEKRKKYLSKDLSI